MDNMAEDLTLPLLDINSILHICIMSTLHPRAATLNLEPYFSANYVHLLKKTISIVGILLIANASNW